MKFEKSALKSGITNICVALLVIAGLCTLQWFCFGKPDMPIVIPIVFWLVGIIVTFVFGWLGISLVQSGGKWQIEIDQASIRWNSPNESVDKSFHLELSELARVETRVRRSSKGRSRRAYILITRTGTERKLSPNSGINLAAVVTELERLGVEHLTVRRGSSAKLSLNG